eukprot:gb/GFBE01056691.1/.p1 GENE.gb/GFBE01056691.1/~~gb/GFBE01056691.1/.p1  ORF type:complete len:375 (+),score=56.73 gb/GFBE01056691.1/:1-1125(+)
MEPLHWDLQDPFKDICLGLRQPEQQVLQQPQGISWQEQLEQQLEQLRMQPPPRRFDELELQRRAQSEFQPQQHERHQDLQLKQQQQQQQQQQQRKHLQQQQELEVRSYPQGPRWWLDASCRNQARCEGDIWAGREEQGLHRLASCERMGGSMPSSAASTARTPSQRSEARSETRRIAWGPGPPERKRVGSISPRVAPQSAADESAAGPSKRRQRAQTPTLYGGKVRLFSSIHDTTPNRHVQMDDLVDRGRSSSNPCPKVRSRPEPRPAPDFRQTQDWQRAHESRQRRGQQLHRQQQQRLQERPALRPTGRGHNHDSRTEEHNDSSGESNASSWGSDAGPESEVADRQQPPLQRPCPQQPPPQPPNSGYSQICCD